MSLGLTEKTRLLAVVRGIPIYPMLGSDSGPDGENQGTPQSGTQQYGTPGQPGTGDGSEEDDDDDEEGGEAASEKDQQISQLRRESKNRRKRLREAEQERESLKKQLQEHADKEKSDLEKANKSISEKDAEIESLRSKFNEAAIEREFLKNNKHKWHDTGAALKLVDLSDVEIKDDGTVEGMDDAIKKVAKDYPFLISKEADSGSASGQPTGSTPNSGNGKKGLDRAALESKYRL